MSSELVTVATFNDPIQAAMARNYLEAGGVRAFLIDELTVATGWGLGNAIGGIKVQVKASHLERAEALLNDLPGDPEEELPEIPATAFATPEMAEQLREEREDAALKAPVTAFATPETAEALREEGEATNPKTLAVERLFRTAVLGLLFWPLQFYALWLLMALTTVEGKVSPNQRWKVGVSFLLNLPLLALIFITLFWLLPLVGRAITIMLGHGLE